MNIRNLFVFLTVLAATTAAAGQSTQISVPKGKAVVLDGRISDEEWKGGLRQQMTGGGELRLLQDGSELYVGVKGLRDGWSHVYVTTGELVYVLHASAALGDATYRLEKTGLWQPVQSFNWSLRQRDQSEETAKARAAFFSAYGWLANNNLMGSGVELEFKLGSKLLKGGDVQLAAVYASDAKSPQYWPETLTDDSLKAELLFGTTPADLKFNRAGWARLRL